MDTDLIISNFFVVLGGLDETIKLIFLSLSIGFFLLYFLIDFDFSHGEGYSQVNTYWINDHYKGIAKQFLNELLTAMKGPNYFCNDDIQTDYFCRSHYTDINIGKWNKPYKLDIENIPQNIFAE